MWVTAPPDMHSGHVWPHQFICALLTSSAGQAGGWFAHCTYAHTRKILAINQVILLSATVHIFQGNVTNIYAHNGVKTPSSWAETSLGRSSSTERYAVFTTSTIHVARINVSVSNEWRDTGAHSSSDIHMSLLKIVVTLISWALQQAWHNPESGNSTWENPSA